jgi:hypothetical protein
LTKEGYFNYSTWASRLKSNGFSWWGETLAFLTQEKDYELLVEQVRRSFLEPNVIGSEDLKNICYLFSSEAECIAYLNCNFELLNEHKLTMIFDCMDRFYKKNSKYTRDDFWNYIAENPALEDDFVAVFTKKHPKKFDAMIRDLLSFTGTKIS